MAHVPVLLEEAIHYLNPKPGENFIDATAGNGGHVAEILKYIEPKGKILGIDWSKNAIMKLQKKFQKEIREERLMLECDSFGRIEDIAEKLQFEKISGILFDLGLSSEELEESGLGFSFKNDEPLLMTYSEEQGRLGLNAAEVVNTYPQDRLEKIFQAYGEERLSRIAAKAIVTERRRGRILTSRQLAELIQETFPARYEQGRLHPATRIFQALRIYVNDELSNLEHALVQAFSILKPNGRIVVISYHSLEDRIVKHFFQASAKNLGAQLLTKKPVVPARAEATRNPRSRSAKLRAIQKS